MSSRVIFQVVDGGILRQIQLEKTSPAYRAIMAVFEAERLAQLRTRDIPPNPPAGTQEHPPLELDDGSSSDASLSSCNLSGTTAMETDEDEQLRRTPKERKTKQKTRFTCVQCGYVGRDGYGLRRHLRTHASEKPYKRKERKTKQKNHFTCVECGYVSPNRDHLSRHLRTHTGEKPYKCRVCDKSFADSGTRRRHERTHTGEKPYNCVVCGKAFSQDGNRRVHERTHTGEKPYTCRMCGKAFAHFNACCNHERTHTGEKPYKCKVCGKTFSRIDKLRTHEKTQHPVARASRKAKSRAAKSRHTLEE